MSQAGSFGNGRGGAILTETPNSGGAVSPVGNNINNQGLAANAAGNAYPLFSYNGGAGQMNWENRTFSTPYVVDSNTTAGQRGTFSTIQAAINTASSGDTIFIRPKNGAYTENLTLKAGVNLTAFGSDSSLNGTGNVVINGNLTFTDNGTVTISGIQLQTNGAAFLTVSGSNASIVNLENCFLHTANSTGIIYSSSNASSVINIINCRGNTSNVGFALYNKTGPGQLFISKLDYSNTGLSTAQWTNSDGVVTIEYSRIRCPVACSATGNINLNYTIILTFPLNITAYTSAGTQTGNIFNCRMQTGTATAVSIGAGTIILMQFTSISSSAAVAISGLGTLQRFGLSFTDTSRTVDVANQIGAGTLQGTVNITPAVVTQGFVGERISSYVGPSPIGSTVQSSLTQITLPPGIWDISAIGAATNTGGLFDVTIMVIGQTISSFAGTVSGDTRSQFNISGNVHTHVIPSHRVNIQATTTYYLTFQCFYPSGNTTVQGRITAVRAA